ncbi:cell growth-regulating nucleolar protein-like isoform X2 [Gigantopelta aegis]|uniref:cell growth-regulating nucleolar protein-like isoform X2 n=1 Tax=Gigantopelta aegis TaxID=1735272 RepID=UPI001B88D8F8|nr:cell growth-regulating nucleolar protein-like isoform X2 [Gigantopelta aegis]
MVYFNCGACGEALKKNQVEKHCSVCRKCQVVSCVDCSTEFWGNDYQKHIKCISEAEKYSGKNYVPKANKGEAKQEQWIQQVQCAIEKSKCNPNVKRLLVSLQDYPNIPRKKVKFENFLANSLRIRDKNLVSQAWDILMVDSKQTNNEPLTTAKQSEPNESPETCATNGKDIQEDKTLSKRERKEERQKVSKKEKKHSNENLEEDQGLVQPKHKKKKHKDENCKESSIDENQSESLENCAVNGKDFQVNKKLSKRERKEERQKVNKKEKKHRNENVQEVNQCLVQSKHKKKKHCDSEECDKTVANSETSTNKKSKRKRHQSDDETNDCGIGSKKQKLHTEDNSDNNSEEEVPSKKKKTKFNWEEVITEVLKTKGEISLKKLRKKVLSEYAAQGQIASSEEKLWSKFNKKVTKNCLFKVHKDKVKLSSS